VVEPFQPAHSGLFVRHDARGRRRPDERLSRRIAAARDLWLSARAHAQPAGRLLRPDRRLSAAADGGRGGEEADHPLRLRRHGLAHHADGGDRGAGPGGVCRGPRHRFRVPGLPRHDDRLRPLRHQRRQRRHERRRRRPGGAQPRGQDSGRLRRGPRRGDGLGRTGRPALSDRPRPGAAARGDRLGRVGDVAVRWPQDLQRRDQCRREWRPDRADRPHAPGAGLGGRGRDERAGVARHAGLRLCQQRQPRRLPGHLARHARPAVDLPSRRAAAGPRRARRLRPRRGGAGGEGSGGQLHARQQVRGRRRHRRDRRHPGRPLPRGATDGWQAGR
jgi:hypothetical protein